MTHHANDAPLLVLGSGGQIGSLLRRQWRDRRDVVWQSRNRHDTHVLDWHPRDDLTALTDRLPRARAVVALWGVVTGPADALAGNTALALRAIRIAQATGADRVLHCSSAAVYRPGPIPLSETDETAPVSPYGQAKLRMEKAILAAGTDADIPARNCIMRIGNVIGADSLSLAMAQARRSGTPVALDRFADGHGPARSFLSPGDLARILACLADCPLSDLPALVNVAAHAATRMSDIVSCAGLDLVWRTAPETAVPLVALNTTRLTGLPGAPVTSPAPEHLLSDWPLLKDACP